MYESGIQVPVEQVESEKDLGVTFESTLRFDHHILNCVNKANRMSGLIKRTFTYKDKEMLLQDMNQDINPSPFRVRYGRLVAFLEKWTYS